MDFMHCAFFGITTKAWWSQRIFEIGFQLKLGSVIQANGRLSFEDDLRSGDLLYCASQLTSIRI